MGLLQIGGRSTMMGLVKQAVNDQEITDTQLVLVGTGADVCTCAHNEIAGIKPIGDYEWGSEQV